MIRRWDSSYEIVLLNQTWEYVVKNRAVINYIVFLHIIKKKHLRGPRYLCDIKNDDKSCFWYLHKVYDVEINGTFYTNILNGTMDAYGSIISNNLNITIRRLTLITIILMVPTLVASFYGMNVPLPYMNEPITAYFIIILSVVSSLLLGWYFQRKRLF